MLRFPARWRRYRSVDRPTKQFPETFLSTYVMKSYRHSLLLQSCFEFVKAVRNKQGLDDGQDCYPVFDVRIDSNLGYTIAKLIATKAHRVWCIDERGRASGVVSLTDVLRVLAHAVGLVVGDVRRASLSGGWRLGATSGSGTPPWTSEIQSVDEE
ncbi:hypothetical protein BC938DRAFT_472036 [Jimgerdemannia flammicorona]|uniref:CBS domain-containing protein n=1 Tax=Jimgerdemannia flammicorona TaxID=994334 RepID=A0A433Q6Z4_9FUNG|nr:hypothetical protein BC938DRAFT_472036 [Jimgerdemannia flammicorona]